MRLWQMLTILPPSRSHVTLANQPAKGKNAYNTSCTKIELHSKICPLWCAAPCVKIVELWSNQKKSYMQIELERRAKLLISGYRNDSYPVNFFVGAGQKRLYPKYLYPIPNNFKNENTTITCVSTQDNHF